MKRYVPFVIIGVVAIATVVAAGLLYRAKRIAPLTAPTSAEEAVGNDGSLHILGKKDASITMEEFGDFQCPPCGALAEPINRLQKNHAKSVRVIFREFPLVTHAHAPEAAFAAEAAGLQGRFWQMHDLLYREQAKWSQATDARELFRAYAGSIGVNLRRYDADVQGEVVKGRVKEDQARGAKLGVSTTPTIFINGQSVPPASLRPDLLEKLVEQRVAATR